MLTSVFAAITLGIMVFWQNYVRHRQRPKYELTPNCLLTRHPLLFLTGRRSIFYFLGYWNWIPAYLRDHGYEVQVLNLPWRDELARREGIHRHLVKAQKQGRRYHVIGDRSCERDLRWLCGEDPQPVVSCTMVGPPTGPSTKPISLSPEDLRPLRRPLEIWTIGRDSSRLSLQTRWLLCLHLLFSGPRHDFSPDALGLTADEDPSQLGQSYLQFAISLAERELKWSH